MSAIGGMIAGETDECSASVSPHVDVSWRGKKEEMMITRPRSKGRGALEPGSRVAAITSNIR